MTPQEEAKAALGKLLPRRRQVLVMLARGLCKKRVARKLGVTEKTVSTLTGNAYKDLGIHKAAQAAVICCLAGEITDWRAI